MFQSFVKFLKFCWTIWDVYKIDPILILLTLFHKFPITLFAPKMTISMIWSYRSVLPSQNIDAHLFHVQKKQRFSWFLMIFTILWLWAQGPWGPWGHAFFWVFLKICLMVWDLSRSVRMMFRSPGNPLINFFRLLFNSKCHF